MNNSGIKISKEELIKLIDQKMFERVHTKAERLEREQLQKELDNLRRSLRVETD